MEKSNYVTGGGSDSLAFTHSFCHAELVSASKNNKTLKLVQGDGFTLAEVLITLAIIGVVAALTIPTVVLNYQKTQTVTQLKKTYAALANTTNLAIAEYGPITEWDIKSANEGGTGLGSIDFAEKYLTPYLKVSKNCKNDTAGICRFNWTYLNKSGSSHFDEQYTRFYLNDGTFIAILSQNGTQKYADIYIDINGQKKPNTFGKDIFRFFYFIYDGSPTAFRNGKFIPEGFTHPINDLIKDGDTYNCNKNARGLSCSALIMKQGWQITNDYPWN